MGFAQFLTLLVAACLLLLGGAASLLGFGLTLAQLASMPAVLFAAAVVVARRGAGAWLPLACWLVLGAAVGAAIAPTLAAEFGARGAAWAEFLWPLAFLALLRGGAGGWGDGALLGLCMATSRAGAMVAMLHLEDEFQRPWTDLLPPLGGLVAGLAALLLGSLARRAPLRQLGALAWLGLGLVVTRGIAVLSTTP